MASDESPPRRRPNADEKRAIKAASIAVFVRKYQRKAQRGVEPNDRDIEKAVKRMNPMELDRLMRDDEE
jgi:hypothetical protein